jgi:hypothetical protein
MTDNGATQRTAAYVPWRTFRNALDRLISEGLPNRVDKSVFSNFSGSSQTQLLAALKFLDLIDDNQVPTETLRTIATVDEGQRRELLQSIITSAYGDLVALDLTRATPEQLSRTLSTVYGLTGTTARKAEAFFLSAAREVGIPLSKFIDKPKKAGSDGASPKRRRSKQRPAPTPTPAPTVQAAEISTKTSASGTSKTVNLVSGGTLTLSATLDLFSLKGADRNFVFSLIDMLEDYEAKNAANVEKEEPS